MRGKDQEKGVVSDFQTNFPLKLPKSVPVPEGPHLCVSGVDWAGWGAGCLSLPVSPPPTLTLLGNTNTSQTRLRNIWMGTNIPTSGQLQQWLAPGSEYGNARGCGSASLSGLGLLSASGHSSILPTICSCHQSLAPPRRNRPLSPAANNNPQPLSTAPNPFHTPTFRKKIGCLTLGKAPAFAWCSGFLVGRTACHSGRPGPPTPPQSPAPFLRSSPPQPLRASAGAALKD